MRRSLVLLIFATLASGCWGGTDFAGTSAKNSSHSKGDDQDDDDEGDDDDGEGIGTDGAIGTGDQANGGSVNTEIDGAGTGSDGDLDISSEESVVRLRQRCGTAAEVSDTQNLDFPATRGQSCPFGQDYNLSAVSSSNTTVRAIVEQQAQISLPPGAVLCSMSLSAATANLKYDDYILFTFEDILVSSGQFPKAEYLAAGMTETAGLVKFEPAKAVGHLPTNTTVNGRSSPQYCGEGGTCTLPLSNQSGAMAIDLPASWFARLPAETLSQGEFVVSTIVTGQGSESPAGSDCGHTGISFVATVRYVQ